MPKNKTHSGASKRFRVTGSGKIAAQAARSRRCLRAAPTTGSRKKHRRNAGTVEVEGRRQARQEAAGSLSPPLTRPSLRSKKTWHASSGQ